MKAAIIPWKSTSESALFLSQHLEARLIRRISDLRPDEIVINWGSGELNASNWKPVWLNRPSAVCRSVNKLTAFECFERGGVSHPDWTRSLAVAQRWLQNGEIVLARTTAEGHMGAGIQIIQGTQRLPAEVSFYSKHVKHDEEYRVHVFRGRVINAARKEAITRTANPLVRNWGDWRFQNCEVLDSIKEQGIAAIRSLGLDFGAVDIGYRRSDRKAIVFETNTAPGAGHNTITRFAEVFQQYLNRL